MTLKLIVEQAPHRQAEMERDYAGGKLVIGRGDEADWQLNDPDMYVSRRHAILTEEDGRTMVTDASSGGLYIDNAANPLGAGNSVALEPGMRLRMGDFVVRVEGAGATAAPEAPAARSGGMSFSFDFGPPDEPGPEPAKRPESLPDPFGLRPSAPQERTAAEKRPPRPLDQDDPFALDLRGTFDRSTEESPRRRDDAGGGGFFGEAEPRAPRRDDESGAPRDGGPSRERVRDPFASGFGPPPPSSPDHITPSPPARPESDEGDDIFGLGAPQEPPAPERPAGAGHAPPPAAPDAPAEPPRSTGIGPDIFGTPPEPPRGPERSAPPEPPRAPEPPRPPEWSAPPGAAAPPGTPPPQAAPAQAAPPQAAPPHGVPPQAAPPQGATPVAPGDDALRAAFYRGLGLDPAQMPADDPVAEMEAAGRRMRALIEGLMHMLRARAQEKSRARVAQTLISSADVNPLKFLVTPEDAAAALMHPRGHGYLEPDAAIAGAFRDLADHQLRTWTALQTSLRRMIDRFDPAEIEREMQDTGLMERLMAGGRSAKLWQLYTERYGEIARSAEEQFLGEVGPDFREAYESKGSP